MLLGSFCERILSCLEQPQKENQIRREQSRRLGSGRTCRQEQSKVTGGRVPLGGQQASLQTGSQGPRRPHSGASAALRPRHNTASGNFGAPALAPWVLEVFKSKFTTDAPWADGDVPVQRLPSTAALQGAHILPRLAQRLRPTGVLLHLGDEL